MRAATESEIVAEIEKYETIARNNNELITGWLNAVRLLRLRFGIARTEDLNGLLFEIRELNERIARKEAYDQKVRTHLLNLGTALAVARTRTFPFYNEVQNRQPAPAH